MTSQFKIDASYNILASPADETQARFLMTNSTEEAKFLAFSKSFNDLGQNLRTYTNMSSICGKLNDLNPALRFLFVLTTG